MRLPDIVQVKSASVACALFVTPFILGAFIYIGGVWLTLPDIEYLAYSNPERTIHMTRRAAQNGLPEDAWTISWTSIEDVSSNLTSFVVESEDSGFYRHRGVYWKGTRKAARRYFTGRATGGASTITQQLARNLHLNTHRTLHRKTREIMLAMRMERRLSKERILELYINVVEWGDGVWGIASAAQHYFDKTPDELDAFDSVVLTSILPSPRRALYGDNLSRATKLQQRVLRHMAHSRKIDGQEWHNTTRRLNALTDALLSGQRLTNALREIVVEGNNQNPLTRSASTRMPTR